MVEDNDSIREAVAGYLALDDHEVIEFASAEGVLAAAGEGAPDLYVLDIMLPGESGFQLAKRIRSTSATPFLFLSAREAESDRIFGFELGADDYIVKPFSPKELVLRVNVILRRASPDDGEPVTGGGLERGAANGSTGQTNIELPDSGKCLSISRRSHAVTIDGQELALTASEWRILVYLSTRPAAVVSREQILTECLDYLHDGSERTVDTHVKNLRAKLGDPRWIETVRGFGYRFAGAAR